MFDVFLCASHLGCCWLQGVRPEAVVHKDKRWEFNPKDRVLIRCNCVQPDPRSGTRLVNDDALSLWVFRCPIMLCLQQYRLCGWQQWQAVQHARARCFAHHLGHV